jgi:hypothetical protein
MNMWETDFDPLAVLMQCQNNIQQCAVAINTGSELMKEMGKAFRHQQEVIEQLQFNNRKLAARLNQIDSELTLLRCQKN